MGLPSAGTFGRFVLEEIDLVVDRGGASVRENPLNSLHWWTPQEQAMWAPTSWLDLFLIDSAKDVPVESLEAAAPIDVEDLDQQLVECEVPDPEDPVAEQENNKKDEKVPDSKRFQALFGAKSTRKSTNRQSKATRRRSSLNKQDEDKEEEGWPPVPSDSSGDEMVWIGGGQRPSPVRRHRPSSAVACPEPPPAGEQPPEPLLQKEPVQAASPGRRLPWQSHAVPSQPQAPLPQTSEPQATSPGRRLPWQSHGET
eukprot:s549_g1.t1